MSLLLSLLGTILLHIGSTQWQDSLVVVTPPVVTASDGVATLQYSIMNRSSQAVTAWHVEFTVSLSNGKVVTGGHAKDGYESYALHRESTAVVYAQQSLDSRELFSEISNGVTVTSATAILLYAVFADGSWIGDATAVNDIFRRREADAQALAFISGAFRAGFAAGTGHVALRAALQQLNSADSVVANSVFTNVARKNLQRILERTRSDQQDLVDSELRNLLLTTEAQWQAAEEHRRSKGKLRIGK